MTTVSSINEVIKSTLMVFIAATVQRNTVFYIAPYCFASTILSGLTTIKMAEKGEFKLEKRNHMEGLPGRSSCGVPLFLMIRQLDCDASIV